MPQQRSELDLQQWLGRKFVQWKPDTAYIMLRENTLMANVYWNFHAAHFRKKYETKFILGVQKQKEIDRLP